MMNADDETPHGAWWRRIGWLIFIWALSVAVLGGVALLLKWMMRAVGLAS
jgi:Protein of unknown function (DUF2474)